MSVVTNVILKTDLDGDGDGVEKLNARLSATRLHGVFQSVDDHAGGTKALECTVYMAAFNNLDIEEFLRWADQSFDYWQRERVQIFIQEQEQHKFEVYHLRGDAAGGGIDKVLEWYA